MKLRSDRIAALLLLAGLSGALPGCKASLEAKVTTKEDNEADFDKPMAKEELAAMHADDTGKEVALLGARQDLSYKGPSTAACQCLEVALGQPGDRAFQWAGEVPKTSHDGQLVIALSSAGIACPALAGKEAPGASYWGYQVVGNDVVVVVEKQVAGRPVASGAIIPRPTGTGQVFVRPSENGRPYGLPLDGKGDRCQIGKLDPVAPAVAPPPKDIGGEQSGSFSAESAN